MLTHDHTAMASLPLMITQQLYGVSSSQLLCFLCSLQWGRILSVPGKGNDGNGNEKGIKQKEDERWRQIENVFLKMSEKRRNGGKVIKYIIKDKFNMETLSNFARVWNNGIVKIEVTSFRGDYSNPGYPLLQRRSKPIIGVGSMIGHC